MYDHLLHVTQSKKKRFTKFPNKISLRKQSVLLGENTSFNHRYNYTYTKKILAWWICLLSGIKTQSWLLNVLIHCPKRTCCDGRNISCIFVWSVRCPPQYYNQHFSANSCLSQCIYTNHPSPFVSTPCSRLCQAVPWSHPSCTQEPQHSQQGSCASCQGYLTPESVSQPSPMHRLFSTTLVSSYFIRVIEHLL